jgi:hypothetical protein
MNGCNPSSVDQYEPPQVLIPSPDLPGAPKIPKLAILRPFCETSLGNINAGSAFATAFVAEIEGHSPVVLTVMSLLSKANGLSRDASPSELNSIISGVSFGSAFGEMDSVLLAEKALDLYDQDKEATDSDDLLAVALPDTATRRVGTLPLAKSQPAIGSKIWLSAALTIGAPPSQRQHVAIVKGEDEKGNMTYTFENLEISFEGTPGAPMLNEEGAVVAVHLFGEKEGGELIGHGNPTSKFLPDLKSAIERKP